MANELTASLGRCRDYFFMPRVQSNGVVGLGSGKFWLVLVLYLAAFVIFAKDPFFMQKGVFVYQQGIVTLLLSGALVAAFNWEMCLFGKPSGANLLLQLVQVCPMSLFIARITSVPSQPPVDESWMGQALEWLKNGYKGTMGSVLEFIPLWIKDIFVNWQISMLLALVLFFLCFRKLSLKVAGIVLVFCILFAKTVSTGISGYLLLGMLLLGGGMAIQFCRYDRILYYENVLHHLQKGASLDSLFLSTSLRIMSELYDNERMSENNMLGIVRGEYDPKGEWTPAELRFAANEVLRRMMFEYDLVTSSSDAGGMFLKANMMLYFNDSLLTQVAVFPRTIFALVIAALWVVLPVDPIPDVVPVVGLLDDVAVTIFSGIVLKNSVESNVQRRQ